MAVSGVGPQSFDEPGLTADAVGDPAGADGAGALLEAARGAIAEVVRGAPAGRPIVPGLLPELMAGLPPELAASLPPELAASLAALSTPEGFAAAVEGLEQLLAAPPEEAGPNAEKAAFHVLQQLHEAGRLDDALVALGDAAGRAGALPPMSDEQKAELLGRLGEQIVAELQARNASGTTADHVFPDWQSLSADHLALVRDTQVPAAGPGTPSAFDNPVFIEELEQLAGTTFSEGNTVSALIDGPASFEARDRLIDGAKESIHIMSWAFYDDDTGMAAAKKLIARKAEGLDVKVMVDGQIAGLHHHDDVIKLLKEGGVEVIGWRDPERPFDGQHRKFMIADGKEAIAGGMNFGDVYSHRGEADEPKWRDTDVLYQGPAVRSSAELFASVWNEQVESRQLGVSTVDKLPDAEPVEEAPEGARAAVVNDTPGPQGNANILLATLKAVEGATESVDIENAYFIQTPAVKDVLLKAIERGVRVRILTNSAESVDEPIVSAPILASLPELVDAGAEVFLKQGDTLHSKFMVVDGRFSSVGSYNLHPRSERYEGEMNLIAVDKDLSGQLTTAFEDDVAAATRVNSGADIDVPRSALSELASRYFWNQL